MNKELNNFAEVVASIALEFSQRARKIATSYSDEKVHDRLEIGKAIGQIDAYYNAAKEILDMIENYGIQSEYIKTVQEIFDNLDIKVTIEEEEERGNE